MDGWGKTDPPTRKMLPVESDVPEFMASLGRLPLATELDKAIGDLGIIAFYYLLRVGEYTCKGNRNETKQTVQFKFEDISFFKRNLNGDLRCLPRNAPDGLIATADGATLKLDNQKNGWKGACIFQEANGDPYYCPVRAVGRRYLHLRKHTTDPIEVISAYWETKSGAPRSVTADHISKSIKLAAGMLHYPTDQGIPVQRINTHSLRSGGANVLALSGYSDTEIQKMGRWRGATFKEYIREELACYAQNMSRKMKQKFNFINIAGNAFHDITTELVLSEYSTTTPAA